MATPNIQQEMMQYFMQLNDKEKRSVLQMIKTFLQGKKDGPSKRISIEQYNQELAEAEAEYERGEFVEHEEVLKMLKSRFSGK